MKRGRRTHETSIGHRGRSGLTAAGTRRADPARQPGKTARRADPARRSPARGPGQGTHGPGPGANPASADPARMSRTSANRRDRPASPRAGGAPACLGDSAGVKARSHDSEGRGLPIDALMGPRLTTHARCARMRAADAGNSRGNPCPAGPRLVTRRGAPKSSATAAESAPKP